MASDTKAVSYDASDYDRFLDKFTCLPGGCWVWSHGINPRTGYGQFWFRGHGMLPHRFSYLVFKGPLIIGLQIDHLCNNRTCVNPDHLLQVSAQKNTLRSRVAPAAVNSRKEVCVREHVLSGDNLYENSGRRHCRECRRDWKRNFRIERRVKLLPQN